MLRECMSPHRGDHSRPGRGASSSSSVKTLQDVSASDNQPLKLDHFPVELQVIKHSLQRGVCTHTFNISYR